jgi:hypothetical protein
MQGIDILVIRGPSLDAIIGALQLAAGVPGIAICRPGDPTSQRLAVMAHTTWAVIHDYQHGDISYKIDLDGGELRDYVGIARSLGGALGTAVAWPDESTLSATAAILRTGDGSETQVTLDDFDHSNCACGGMVIVRGC